MARNKEMMWDEAKAFACDTEANFQGRIMASVECEGSPWCFDWLVADHPGAFLRLIAGFPAREREALILHYLLGKSHKQMSKVLGYVPSSITELLSRAVRRLQGGTSETVGYKYGIEYRSDPDVLGCFRIAVADAGVVFSHAASHIRVGTSQTGLLE